MRSRTEIDARSATAEYFPGSNPHPVMRIDDQGVLTYANVSSRPLLETLGVDVGRPLSAEWRRRLDEASADSTRLELKVGPKTYEILAVRLAELGFTNVYATDVSAEKAIVKFPDQNPNPVFRVTWDGSLVYANAASAELIAGLGAVVDQPLRGDVAEPLLAAARAGNRSTTEVASDGRRYELLPVDVPEFGFINVYGTDVTAVRQLELLNRENEALLLNVLPAPIADRLRAGEALIADRFDDVSLMFADIVDFTRLSAGMPPSDLVAVLNEVFTVFDGLVEMNELEKVKTIGDAYMVVGGMSDQRSDHLDRVATMAVELGPAVERIDACRNLGIEFRVGIACGPLVAGVIGTKKFIYDVWGDTVNVASRMESLSLPRRVQVTDVVESRLRSRFSFESRGVIDVKGKGPLETFFLVGHRG
ncbi:MAG: adenylate/guanylate cyclase domain-containing protein [Chloroflexota bacterium]